ncbi:acidic mammalian chitinase-like isoform X2 [Dermacentor variabilis]|uniref:acidic mammalian chitinase-like isoform X2 n=1 Tax=Dermacentor variabilis TaxID=34621 RepID=UPI003F5B6613
MRSACLGHAAIVWALSVAAALAVEETVSTGPCEPSNHVPPWQSGATMRRVCYYTLPSTLDPSRPMADLCTHLVCGFAAVLDDAMVPQRPEDTTQYKRLVALKLANPSLRVMLSLGATGSDGVFSAVIAAPDRRQKFIASVITVLRQYGFDGIDIDWEFPGQGALPEDDRKNFGVFLKEVRESFKNESHASHGNELLLSVAVAATAGLIDTGYDARVISRYADFINLMSYDYHMYEPYLPFTGHNSPLFRRKVEKSIFSTLHVAWSAEYWVQRGADRSKLIVGLPLYGRTYTLLRQESHGFDAPATGTGPGNGSVAYPWICQFLKDGATSVFDDESQAPYAYKNFTWIGYDDVASIRSKVVWVVARGFGGVMTFALDYDDANNECGHGPFPIHEMIRNMLSS